MTADTQALGVRTLSPAETDAVAGGLTVIDLGFMTLFGDAGGYVGIEIGHGAFGLALTDSGLHGHIGSSFF